jgi:hypothetical protein
MLNILYNTHEYGSIETIMTLLQSAQNADAWMYWINMFIQFFQHNNKIVNDQVPKNR